MRKILVCLLASALAAQKTQPLFENDQVIINAPHPNNVDVPGSTHKAHEHKLNRVMVYMHKGGEYLHYLDGRTEDLKWSPGQVLWSPANGPHYSEMKPDTPPFTGPMIIDVGIKKTGDPRSRQAAAGLDALKADSKHYKLEFENAQVRVLRVALAAGERTALVESPLNRLVVYISDANARETQAGGKAEVVQRKAAEFRWVDVSKESGAAKQKIENLSDKPFEAVIVEFRS
jgi:hypothetical protein